MQASKLYMLPAEVLTTYLDDRVSLCDLCRYQQLPDCASHGSVEPSPAHHHQHLFCTVLRVPHLQKEEEETAPFGLNLRSQILHRAAQAHTCSSAFVASSLCDDAHLVHDQMCWLMCKSNLAQQGI